MPGHDEQNGRRSPCIEAKTPPANHQLLPPAQWATLETAETLDRVVGMGCMLRMDLQRRDGTRIVNRTQAAPGGIVFLFRSHDVRNASFPGIRLCHFGSPEEAIPAGYIRLY